MAALDADFQAQKVPMQGAHVLPCGVHMCHIQHVCAVCCAVQAICLFPVVAPAMACSVTRGVKVRCSARAAMCVHLAPQLQTGQPTAQQLPPVKDGYQLLAMLAPCWLGPSGVRPGSQPHWGARRPRLPPRVCVPAAALLACPLGQHEGATAGASAAGGACCQGGDCWGVRGVRGCHHGHDRAALWCGLVVLKNTGLGEGESCRSTANQCDPQIRVSTAT